MGEMRVYHFILLSKVHEGTSHSTSPSVSLLCLLHFGHSSRTGVLSFVIMILICIFVMSNYVEHILCAFFGQLFFFF
jgi:hypothetical protein